VTNRNIISVQAGFK